MVEGGLRRPHPDERERWRGGSAGGDGWTDTTGKMAGKGPRRTTWVRPGLSRFRRHGAAGRPHRAGSGAAVIRRARRATHFLEVLVYHDSGATIYVCGSSLQYTTFSMVRTGL